LYEVKDSARLREWTQGRGVCRVRRSRAGALGASARRQWRRHRRVL